MPPRSPMGGVKTHVEDNHTHDVRYVLRNLWKYLYRYRFGMFAVLALSLLSNVLALLGPRLSGAAIDAITGGEHVNFPSVYRYALLMLAFYAVSAGLSFLISVYMVRLSQKIVSAMRCDAFQSISRLPVGFTDRHAIGDILSVTPGEIGMLALTLAGVILFWVVYANRLTLTAIHPQLASSRGIPVGLSQTFFVVAIAVVVTLSISSVGLLILNSLLVLPAASSRNISRNLKQYSGFSVLFALLAGIGGLTVSYFTECSTGAAISLILALIFALTFCLRKRRA